MYSNKDLAVAFAHKETKGKSAHMFIQGATIYSFGKHFVIARRRNGYKNLVDFTTREYSITTTKHKSLVLFALTNAGYTIVYKELYD